MGLIINAIIVVFLAGVIVGGYAYYNPEATKVFMVNGLNKLAPELIDIDLNDFIEQLPKISKEMIDKNPKEEKDFAEEKELSPEIKQQSISILGRPKKIVEFFCLKDSDCSIYFKNGNAKCDLTSGICYEHTYGIT